MIEVRFLPDAKQNVHTVWLLSDPYYNSVDPDGGSPPRATPSPETSTQAQRPSW